MNRIQEVKELPIEIRLSHYLEERALDVALEKCSMTADTERVTHLIRLREELTARRAAHHELMIKQRHARGEIYADTKVKSINAMGPNQVDLESIVATLYRVQSDAIGVLKAYARAAFGLDLVNKRFINLQASSDIADDVRKMQSLEETFSAQWLAAIGDAQFSADVFQARRDAVTLFRTSNTAMYFACTPPYPQIDAIDGVVLGKAWNQLDKLAKTLHVAGLSTFIGIEGQTDEDGAPAEEVLPSVEVLLTTLTDSAQKLPGKRATVEALIQVRAALLWLKSQGGRAYFQVDL